jgi:hypothetical protein
MVVAVVLPQLQGPLLVVLAHLRQVQSVAQNTLAVAVARKPYLVQTLHLLVEAVGLVVIEALEIMALVEGLTVAQMVDQVMQDLVALLELVQPILL